MPQLGRGSGQTRVRDDVAVWRLAQGGHPATKPCRHRRRLSPIRVSGDPQLVMDRSAMLAVMLVLVAVGAAPAACVSAIPAPRRAACPRLQWRALRPAEV